MMNTKPSTKDVRVYLVEHAIQAALRIQEVPSLHYTDHRLQGRYNSVMLRAKLAVLRALRAAGRL